MAMAPMSLGSNLCQATLTIIEVDGSLLLPHVGVEDEGLYECGVENETSFVDRVNVTVRSKFFYSTNVLWQKSLLEGAKFGKVLDLEWSKEVEQTSVLKVLFGCMR
ncbi:unnamed protein product [Colias eurytheme]|nr:unnamed protein product [Colias eurytheme]